jgi:flagellar basal-body rod modification protein FlgD
MPTSVQPQAIGAASTPVTPPATNSTLGKDDFLKLLTTQLRYQDPLNPMQGTEFATQLAQFSAVEQLTNINTNLTQSLDANALLTQVIGNSLAPNLIGSQVRAESDTVNYSGSGDIKLGYTLPAGCESVSINVYDANGNLVRTVSHAATTEGDNTFSWDGKNDFGNTVDTGKYKFVVDARDEKGKSVSSAQFIYGVISGVRFKSDGTYFVVDGTEISISKILEILKG